MSRITEILIRARDTLADPDKERWSDARLVRLVDECQKAICVSAKLLKTSVSIAAKAGQSNYLLPDNYILLTRALYNKSKLEIVGSDKLDFMLGIDWTTIEGIPQYLSTDNLNRQIIRLSPTPKAPITVDTNDDIYIRIYYVKMPDTITSIDDDLELEELYDTMITRYVIGMCLRDDMDTQNRLVGNEELAMYNNWMKEITLQASKDLTDNNLYTTVYRSFE